MVYISCQRTLFLFCKDVIYRNIDADICEMLRIFANKHKAKILKRIEFCALKICKLSALDVGVTTSEIREATHLHCKYRKLMQYQNFKSMKI